MLFPHSQGSAGPALSWFMRTTTAGGTGGTGDPPSTLQTPTATAVDPENTSTTPPADLAGFKKKNLIKKQNQQQRNSQQKYFVFCFLMFWFRFFSILVWVKKNRVNPKPHAFQPSPVLPGTASKKIHLLFCLR